MAYDSAWSRRRKGIVLLFEVFDQQCQKLENTALLSRTMAFSQQPFQSGGVALILFFRVDDVRQHINQQLAVLMPIFNLGRASHFFQFALSYSVCVSI